MVENSNLKNYLIKLIVFFDLFCGIILIFYILSKYLIFCFLVFIYQKFKELIEKLAFIFNF